MLKFFMATSLNLFSICQKTSMTVFMFLAKRSQMLHSVLHSIPVPGHLATSVVSKCSVK